jgi:hypothetical protein
MPLIAHYKLDGDATDSVGNNNGINVGNWVTWVNGKIGQAADFTRANASSIDLPTTFSLGTENIGSLSFWAVHSNGVDAMLFSGPSAWIRFQNNNITIANKETYLYLIIGTVPDYVNWHHYSFIFTSNFVSCYIDGVYSGGSSLTPPYNLGINLIGYYSGSSYAFDGLLDDVRIYNHALSQKEVKELSRAKVLHYDFDQFEEPTENLLNYTTQFSLWNKSASSGSLPTVTEDAYLSPFGVLEADKLFIPNDGTYPRISQNWTPQSVTTNTFSIYLKSAMEAECRVQIGVFRKSPWDLTSLNTFILSKNWERYSFQFAPLDTSSHQIYIGSHDLAKGMEYYIWGAQLEQKDHATPFVNGSRTGIVKDISGYGNDAPLALATTPQWVEDSKIGKGCYRFDGTKELVTNKLFFDNINQEWTATGWVKLDVNNTYQQFNNFNLGNRIIHSSLKALLYANSGVNDHYVYSSSTIPASQWVHIAFVYRTSDRTCKFYLNGNLDASSGNYDVTDVPSGFEATTVFGTALQGLLDDVRIYATALSSDDILELYQTRAQIDKNGNMFAINFEEDPVSDGLVGWWPFSGDSLDKSGYENDGIVTGATLTTGITGEANTAYSFDGVNDYIEAINTEIVLGQTYSLAWWQAPIFVAVERHPMGLSSSNNQIYHSAADNKLNWYNSGASCNSPINDTDNVWVHYVLVSNSTTGRIIYRNGVSVATSVTPSESLSSATITIGRRYGYTSTYYWAGKIQDVRIYNKALTQDEITLLYNLGLGLV